MAVRRIFYVTNRRHSGRDRFRPSSYGPRVSDDGIENLRLGKVSLTVSPREIHRRLTSNTSVGPGDGSALMRYFERRMGNAEIKAYPEKLLTEDHKMAAVEDQKVGSRMMFEELREAMSGARDVLVFVHGYAVSWKKAVGMAASLQEMLNRRDIRGSQARETLVILFSWPSDGMLLPWTSYRSDRSEGAGSGFALGRALLKLRDYLGCLTENEYCNGNVHLLCHSMGNWVLENAIQRILDFSGPGPLPRVLGEVFLCSPDVNDNVFDEGQPMRPLLNLSSGITLYYNRGDAALRVSDLTKGHPDRLGTSGVAQPQFLHKRLHQVDCSETVGGLVEHEYFLAGRINEDIRQSLDALAQDAEIRSRTRGAHANSWTMV